MKPLVMFKMRKPFSDSHIDELVQRHAFLFRKRFGGLSNRRH